MTITDPSFIKLHTKVTVLLGLLAVGVPLMIATLGYGVLELVSISEKVGVVDHLQTSVVHIEDRLNNHIEQDDRRFQVSYIKEDNTQYTYQESSCHVEERTQL